MLNSFKNVLTSLQNTVPKLTLVQSKWYVLDNNSNIALRVSKPDPFSDYGDVIARITLFYQDKVTFDCLVTYDTDLNSLCEKIKKKIETNVIKGRTKHNV